MKQKIFFLFFFFISSYYCFSQNSHQVENGIAISGGMKHFIIREGSFICVSLDFRAFPVKYVSFSGSVQWNFKQYWSFEPCALVGLIGVSFMNAQGLGIYENRFMTLIVCASALSSLGIPIPLGKYFEIAPSYSLLRFTKLDKETKIKLNGSAGLNVSFYYKLFYTNLSCEYTYGYGKKTPYQGLAYGIHLGVFF